MFFSVPIAPADKGDKSPGNCISIRFFRWFFAVFTTSLESQAINEPEGARALFIVQPEIWCFLRPPWARRARLRLGLDCLCYTLNQRHRVHRCAAMASREAVALRRS